MFLIREEPIEFYYVSQNTHLWTGNLIDLWINRKMHWLSFKNSSIFEILRVFLSYYLLEQMYGSVLLIQDMNHKKQELLYGEISEK